MSEMEIQNELQQAAGMNGDEALRFVDNIIRKCEQNNIDPNLFCKVRILKGDLLLKRGDTQAAVQEYQEASRLDEMDGKIDSPELRSKLENVMKDVSGNMHKSVEQNSTNSNDRDLSSMLLNQVLGSSGSNSSKFSMLSSLMSAGSGGQSKGNGGFLSLIQQLSSSGVNANQQKQSGGFDVSSLMSMASKFSGNNNQSHSSGSSGTGGALVGSIIGGL